MNLSFRHYYWRWLKNLVFLFVLFAILMTIARTSFALYFGDWNSLLTKPNDLKKAFWLGFRFDLMPLAYVNVLPFLILNIAYFLPGKKVIKIVRFLIIALLSFGYFFIAWLYVCDYGFYSFYQEHINIIFFGLFEDDTKALLLTIWKNYSVPLWATILFFLHFGFLKFVKFLFSPFEFDLKTKRFDFKVPATLLGGLVLIALMARGNFTRLPLSLEDAFISDNEFINEISLNGALSLNRALKIRRTYGKDQYDYLKNYNFSDWQEAFTKVRGVAPKSDSIKESLIVKTPNNPYAKENPPHVVLVVMESLGSYWDEQNSEDFQLLGSLKKHFDQGVLFKNFLSAENGTIGSIVSVATSQVIRPGARFLSESEFMQTTLQSSGNIPFKESGYDTHFIYGGKLGWRNLGKYLSFQKYDYLWGADEIKDAMPELNNFAPRDLGNEWGIFDEYLYTFIDEQLRTATKPQFFLVLTTSNHPPFEYPSSYQPLPLELSKETLANITVDEELAKKRFSGLQYGNQKMAEFLSKIQKSSLNDHTIVALTGDHSFWIAKDVVIEKEFRRFAVPFYLKIPERYRPQNIDTTKFGSHEDIFPTLINLSLSGQSYVKLGNDIINEESEASNSAGIFANKTGAFHHNRYWKWNDINQQLLEPTEKNPELEQLVNKSRGQIAITDAFLKNEKIRKRSDEGNGQQ